MTGKYHVVEHSEAREVPQATTCLHLMHVLSFVVLRLNWIGIGYLSFGTEFLHLSHWLNNVLHLFLIIHCNQDD